VGMFNYIQDFILLPLEQLTKCKFQQAMVLFIGLLAQLSNSTA